MTLPTLNLLPDLRDCFALKSSQEKVPAEKRSILTEIPTDILSCIGLFLDPISFSCFAQMGLEAKDLHSAFLSTSSINGNDGPIVTYIQKFLERKNHLIL